MCFLFSLVHLCCWYEWIFEYKFGGNRITFSILEMEKNKITMFLFKIIVSRITFYYYECVKVHTNTYHSIHQKTTSYNLDFDKEIVHPHVLVRIPCYDLTPVSVFTVGLRIARRTSGTHTSHGLTGGEYKTREQIHRDIADSRLLAIPTSWSRVADSNLD